MHRKANRADIESLLNKKAEIFDLQSLAQQVDQKVDMTVFEQMNNQLYDLKADRAEFLTLREAISHRAEKSEIEFNITQLQSLRSDFENKFQHIIGEFDS